MPAHMHANEYFMQAFTTNNSTKMNQGNICSEKTSNEMTKNRFKTQKQKEKSTLQTTMLNRTKGEKNHQQKYDLSCIENTQTHNSCLNIMVLNQNPKQKYAQTPEIISIKAKMRV